MHRFAFQDSCHGGVHNEQRKPYAVYNGNVASGWDQWYYVLCHVWQDMVDLDSLSDWSFSELCSL